MSRIVLRGNDNRGIFTNNNTPSINPSGDLVMNENTSVFGNNIQPQDASSNFNVGSDLTTGNLVMGSTDVSSNTTIVGGESIDISSNGDINFTASNSIFTGDIYGNYILANHFNANDASSNLTVGSDLTTGILLWDQQMYHQILLL